MSQIIMVNFVKYTCHNYTAYLKFSFDWFMVYIRKVSVKNVWLITVYYE